MFINNKGAYVLLTNQYGESGGEVSGVIKASNTELDARIRLLPEGSIFFVYSCLCIFNSIFPLLNYLNVDFTVSIIQAHHMYLTLL